MAQKKLFQHKLIVKKSRLPGSGVFATQKIRKNELIEECYVILCKGGDRGLEDYYFDAKGKYAILTGYGIIYNHADEPNAVYTINITKRIARIKAKKTIQKGEEIYISYGDKWFSSRGWKAKK